MARIRSLHPGQTTDEDFLEMGPWARLFALHLRCEADDQGVFQWKPRKLKLTIFPADDVDVEAILDELVRNDQIARFEVDGRAFGVIRNFAKWQSPKSPNATHPLPDEMRAYAGFGERRSGPGRPPGHAKPKPSKEKTPRQDDNGGEGFRNGAETFPLGVGEGEGKGGEKEAAGAATRADARAAAAPALVDVEAFRNALFGALGAEAQGWRAKIRFESVRLPLEWVAAGADPWLDVVPTVKRLAERSTRQIGDWRYFRDAVFEARDDRVAGGAAGPARGRRAPPRPSLSAAVDEVFGTNFASEADPLTIDGNARRVGT